MEELVPMGYLYVPLHVPAPIQFIHEATTAAFYGAIDILAILPYYIEIILQQDTVLLIIIPWACNTGFRTYSRLFRPSFSASRFCVCSGYYVSSARFATTTLYYCT